MAEKIYRAGLIPMYFHENGKIEMLFMKPSDSKYGGSDYQIAKGRIEEDEEPLETAIREASEELGLRQENIDQLYDCGRWLGRTYIYAAIINDKDDFGDFHFETESTQWFTPEEFMNYGRDIHRDVVRHAVSLVEMVSEHED
jgi:8-oxo-dGTP pyrophosphatase MutT (NUDIX family)